MVFVTDAAGQLTQLGQPWTTMTGQTLAEARDFGWTRVVHPEDRETVGELVREAIRWQCAFTVRFRVRSPEDADIWVVSGAVPSFGPPGRTFLGFLGSLLALDAPPTDIATGTGYLRTAERTPEPGSALEWAADHLLAAHSLIAQAGSQETREAVESALRRLGEDLAGETLDDAAARPERH
jgi:Arc/MetJ family transcription regulator